MPRGAPRAVGLRESSAGAPLPTSSVLVGALIWLAAAVAIGASGVLQSLTPPAPQGVLLGLTALCASTTLCMASLRAWALQIDPRVLVAFHVTRFVGIYFLVLYARGELPYAFAVGGGWGDFAVAIAAVGLLTLGPPSPGWLHYAYAAWNVLGLADILFVVGTATRSAMTDAASMQPLQRLPLSLLLTFIVPIIIVTHGVLAYRLARGHGRASRP
jgi:hypothetical protein